MSKLIILNERMERQLCCGQKPPLDLIFCIYLVWEILILSGKSPGMLKSDVCCNHGVGVLRMYSCKDLQMRKRVRDRVNKYRMLEFPHSIDVPIILTPACC